jgi:hypothetical protein
MAQAPFALNPADAVQGVIDWSTPLGMAIDKKAPKALHSEQFDGKAENLQLFLKMFQMRGLEFGWFSHDRDVAIGLIAEDPDDPADNTVYNFIDYYGSVTREDISAHAEAYMFSNDAVSQRAQQDDRLAFRCLSNSLEAGILKVVLLKESKWMVTNPDDEDEKRESAILFLKTIIEECSIQTNATNAAIRTRLASLNDYIVKIGSDISKFNQYVEENMAALSARGEETSDLLVNLWKAYKAAEDKTFADFMKRQCEQYEMSDKEMSPKELMNMAMTKFKLLKEAGEWKEPSETEKTILALKAEVANLKKFATKKKAAHNANPEKKRSNKKGAGRDHDKPNELKSPPADVKKTVMWKNKKFHWCCEENGGKCGGKWRAHAPSECKGPDFFKRKNEEKKDQAPQNKKSKKEPVLRAVAALSGKDDSSVESDE